MTYKGINFGNPVATISHGGELYLNFTDGTEIFKGERLLLLAKKIPAEGVTNDYVSVYIENHGLTAKYYFDADGFALVDLTEIARTYDDPITMVEFQGGLTNYEVFASLMRFGLINPESVIIPPHVFEPYALIVPPTRLISSKGFAAAVVFEYREKGTGSPANIDEYEGNTKMVTKYVEQPSHALSDDVIDKFMIEMYDAERIEHDHSWYLEPKRCSVQYAMVEWVSFTGALRRHVFEVVKAKSESADNFSLMPYASEYRETKGRKDGFTLRIDGLDAYDYWYYADVLLSSDVKVSLDGVNYTQVQVTTKNVTIPDGEAGEKGKLEMAVNWKHYDAVIL